MLQYKFFIIPVRDFQNAESEINLFLRSVRVINIQKGFVDQGANSFWNMAIEYMKDDVGETTGNHRKSNNRVDYKEVLSAEDFAIFVKLREWRKAVAYEEGIPVFTIFTNKQLATIAEKRIMTKTGLNEVAGIGDARVKKYGDAVISIVTLVDRNKEKEAEDETDQRPLSPDPDL